MSCKSHGKMEGYDENCITTEGAADAFPSWSDSSRSITPKGTLFPNLGQAHQAITSRLALRTAGNHITDASPQPASDIVAPLSLRNDHANHSNPVHSTTGNANSDFVIYGRLPSQPDHEYPKDRICQGSDISHLGVSNTALSTDSDEDPFQYDRGSFTVFLQPSREREVSAALRCVSNSSAASVSGLFQHSLSHEPTTPRALQSNNLSVSKGRNYQVPIVDYDWSDEDSKEVKISVRSPPVPPNSPVLPKLGLSEFVQEQENQRGRKDTYTLISDGADWETVATSVGQFDSNRAFASSAGLSGSHPVQVAGSSIADYSDTSSFHVPKFEAFSSRERILPPTVPDHMPSTRHSQALSDTGRPVFLPKQRVHRVNGYLQNPRRMFTDPTTGSSGNSTRSAIVEKLSASIRSRRARKRVQRRNQNLHMHWSKSNFESLGPLSSAYSEEPDERDGIKILGSAQENGTISRNENRDEADSNGREERQGYEAKKGLLGSPIPRVPSPAYLESHNQTKPQSLASATLFSFPLISLQEAARRAAIRAENEDDFTAPSGVRTQTNSSMDLARVNHETAPPIPPIAKPRVAHVRRPTSASIFGIPLAHRGCSDYSQERTVVGHDRGVSNVTSYKSGTPLVTGRSALSRSFRNPFEPVGSSPQSSHPFHGSPSMFGSPPCLVTRDKRDGARAAHMTDFHQISVLEAGASFGGPSEEGYLSWEARKRRQAYYYAMCILCIFPFIAPLVYWGTFDSALSWYTRGETGSLTRRQRRNLSVLGAIISAAWLVVLAVFVTVAVNHEERH